MMLHFDATRPSLSHQPALTREQAAQVLDQRREGQLVNDREVILALRATGDMAPSGGPANRLSSLGW